MRHGGMATVLATGGAGYIGSHVVAELLAVGHRVVILDDFSNADEDTRRGSPRWVGRRRWLRATSATGRCSTPPSATASTRSSTSPG